jgi:GMP synthase (glutamine-hydrolysing)
MKIHWLQHVEFEGLGCIEPWLAENGHEVSCTQLWKFDSVLNIGKNDGSGSRSAVPQRSCFPSIGNVDGLIVMGGPMGVYDEAIYPWLAEEKAFIKEIIGQNKPVLGICLGAQLIAEVLDSKVWKNQHKEIGFFPLRRSASYAGQAISKKVSNHWKLPEQFTAFHWHGDTFGIPEGAVHLASSEATANQAFIYKDNVLALQFHLETTEESLLALYENARDEITDAPFIQNLEEMRMSFSVLNVSNILMRNLLSGLFPGQLENK